MLIPSTFYGLYREVKPKCRKIVTKLKRGATWEEVFSEDTYLDTSLYPGLIVTDGPSSIFGFEPNFHCYVLHKEINEAIISKKMQAERYEDIFTDSLKTHWGLLGLLGLSSSGWFWGRGDYRGIIEDRLSRFLTAFLSFWDEFDSVGTRFADVKTIWGKFTMFHAFLIGPIEIQGLSSVNIRDLRHLRFDARISKEDLAELVEIAQQGVHLFCLKSAENL